MKTDNRNDKRNERNDNKEHTYIGRHPASAAPTTTLPPQIIFFIFFIFSLVLLCIYALFVVLSMFLAHFGYFMCIYMFFVLDALRTHYLRLLSYLNFVQISEFVLYCLDKVVSLHCFFGSEECFYASIYITVRDTLVMISR